MCRHVSLKSVECFFHHQVIIEETGVSALVVLDLVAKVFRFVRDGDALLQGYLDVVA